MKPAHFQELRDRATAVVDRVFARPLRLSPMAAGRADPDRQQHEFDAPLRVAAGKGREPDGGGGKMWSSEVAAGTAMLAIDLRTYVGPSIRQGDRVRDLSLPGRPLYEVARVDDRDSNRLFLELNEL
jgi:hypothetical protein